MELVQPIRDKSMIEDMKRELLKNGLRDYMMFVFGINSGLRVGDILKLKAVDVRDKTHVTIREEKTNKPKRFKIISIKDEIDNYIKGMKDEEYLFKSQKGNNKPITRIQAYRILNKAAKNVGIKENIGTHTLRKTFGYHHYQQFKDLVVLQDIFNHSSQVITKRYIGINQDIIDATMDNFRL